MPLIRQQCNRKRPRGVGVCDPDHNNREVASQRQRVRARSFGLEAAS